MRTPKEYQETLDKAKNKHKDYDYHYPEYTPNEIDILQELVDKEKPKKPIKLDLKEDDEFDSCEDKYYECPNCKEILPIDYEQDCVIKNKRCDDCGQVFDWSDE